MKKNRTIIVAAALAAGFLGACGTEAVNERAVAVAPPSAEVSRAAPVTADAAAHRATRPNADAERLTALAARDIAKAEALAARTGPSPVTADAASRRSAAAAAPVHPIIHPTLNIR